MAKKITLKNKNGDTLCPHTAIEQVQGLKETLDDKLGKTDKVSSATKADIASYANATREPNNHTYSTRRTTANVHYNADGGLHYFLATGSITDNSAPEGHIIHCDWDNDPNSWLAQLLIKHGSNNGLLRRYKQYSTDSWSEWITMLDDKNFDKYALPLTGGTLTGDLTATNFIGNLQGVADVATTLYDDDSGTYKKWKDIDTAITSKIGDQFEDYATKEYVDDEITSRITGVTPSNATETGAGIVRAATQVEVLDGHVSDNDPSEMAFVRPETLQAKLDDYVKNGEANFTGPVNITGTDSTQSKLTFARSLSYISNSGKIGIVPNGQTLSSGYGIWFSNAGIEPGSYMDNFYNLGSSSYKWKNVYAYTFNGTATAVADGCVSTSKIADTAITPEKIQTSIALNGTPSMTVEPTTSSPDKTIASVGLVKEVVADLEIDTRNLLSNSKEITIDATGTASGGTKYAYKKLPIPVKVGDVFTFNCEDMIINAGTDETHALLLYEPNVGALATAKYVSPSSKTAKIVVEKASSNAYLYLYADISNNSAGKSITYKGATLVKGDKPMLLWQRAVEDLNNVVEVANYTVMPNLISASDFELGGIADATGNNSATTSAARARSAGYIPVSAPKITLKSWTDGVVFYLQLYKSDKTHIGTSYSSTGWVSAKYTYTLPAGTAYIRVVMKKLSGANFTASELPKIKIKVENGSKATDWSPTPEDIISGISNAETRSKAHAEDYTNAEIDKIENGQTVAQKANSLYDDDSGTYKNWGEIDTAITRKIGDKFEDYATKSYVQGEISKQVAVPIASETEDGKVKLATPEDVTAVENDISAVNDSAKAVTPYTLKEYIASKNFATSGDISSAVTAAKTTIFFQVAQPAGGKDGDIWIKP